ncbi:hypothetical protein AD930_11765 [Acetobacter malorum]|nr:hypothetical protein AD930_11765 [Acetobacter malorum]
MLGALDELSRDQSVSPEIKKEIANIFSAMDSTMSMAGDLLERALGVDCSPPDMCIDVNSYSNGFLGATVAVYPRTSEDPIPEALSMIDPEGDWEPREAPSFCPEP